MRIRNLVTVLAAVVGVAASAQAGLINAGFETGDLSGWTTYTTANGVLGGPVDVIPFDVDGDGVSTNSARFRVGERAYTPPVREGGGIQQGVMLGAGSLTISADIAAWSPEWGNLDGGLFELLFDGRVVASHDFGGILIGAVERASLLASFGVDAGLHEVGIRMARSWPQNHITPLQFVDNVSLHGVELDPVSFEEPPTEPVPEPGSITLLGLGLLGLARAGRRRRYQRLRQSRAGTRHLAAGCKRPGLAGQ